MQQYEFLFANGAPEVLTLGHNGGIHFPRVLYSLSKELGDIRNLLNRERMKQNPGFDRGERGEYASVIGILGELLARYYLTRAGVPFIAAPLISSGPKPEADIRFQGWDIDVKSIRQDAPDLLVNLDGHRKDKAISHYWFFHLLDDCVAEHMVFPYQEVSNWQVKFCKYSDAYYLPLS